MTKVLYLLRHAKSSWAEAGVRDHDRPLNERGRAACRLIAAHLKSKGLPDAVLCSDARRTRETLERIAADLQWQPRVTHSAQLYLASPAAILRDIRNAPDCHSLMIVGHNPGIEDLAAELSGKGETAALKALQAKFPTGGLARLDLPIAGWPDLSPGRGRLVEFVTPASLAEAGPPKAKAAG